MLEYLLSPEVFSYAIVPILIFLARIVDVSMGTLRIIFTAKGYKFIAPLIGFFEVIIWLLALTRIMENLTNIFCYLAYGAGFATGTFVGMWLEEKLSVGKVALRIVTRKDAFGLVRELRESGYRVTAMDAEGPKGNVKIIFLVVRRAKVPKVLEVVRKHSPKSFYSIEEVRFAYDDEIPSPKPHNKYKDILPFMRKSK